MIKSIAIIMIMSFIFIFTGCKESIDETDKDTNDINTVYETPKNDEKNETTEDINTIYETHKIIYLDVGGGYGYQWTTSGSRASEIDQDGNIYITGVYFDDTNFQTNFIIIKISPDGNEIWRNIYKNDDGNSFVAEDITIGQDGDIYIAGVSTQSYTTSDNRDILTMKIDSDGVQQWVDVVNTESWGYAKSIIVDSNDNIFVTGELKQGGINNQFLIKYSSDGEAKWTKYYSGENNKNVKNLLSDQNNNIYLSGLIQSQENSYLIKVDNNGSQMWKKEFEENNINIAILNNTIYKLSVDNNEINILKIDTSGDTLSQQNINISEEEVLHSIISDKEGSLYLAGSNRDDNDNNNLFFSKISPEGVVLWTHQYEAEYTWTNSILLNEADIFLIGTHYNDNPTFSGFESITSGSGNIYMIQIKPEGTSLVIEP